MKHQHQCKSVKRLPDLIQPHTKVKSLMAATVEHWELMVVVADRPDSAFNSVRRRLLVSPEVADRRSMIVKDGSNV
jgi:hypothetical protein